MHNLKIILFWIEHDTNLSLFSLESDSNLIIHRRTLFVYILCIYRIFQIVSLFKHVMGHIGKQHHRSQAFETLDKCRMTCKYYVE